MRPTILLHLRSLSEGDSLLRSIMTLLASSDPSIQKLIRSAGRVAALLKLPKIPEAVVDCLDLLLGGLIALAFARTYDYQHRSGPVEVDKIVLRTEELSQGKIRAGGKWMAGFHFNGALFRLSSVYDRVLTIVAAGGDVGERRSDAITRYSCELKHAHAIHRQVNLIKHSKSGTHSGRESNADLDGAILAVEEIVALLERWTTQPENRPVEQMHKKIAIQIDRVVWDNFVAKARKQNPDPIALLTEVLGRHDL